MNSRLPLLALATIALLIGAAALALAVANSSEDDDAGWRELSLDLVVKEDGFKFDDVAPTGEIRGGRFSR